MKYKSMLGMDEIKIFASIVISGISLLLFFISLASFKRIREIKLLFISLSFFVFFVKGLLFLFKESSLIFLDLIIIAFLYIAAAKK